MKPMSVLLEVMCDECKGRGKVEFHLCDSEGLLYDRAGHAIPDWKCPGEGQCGETQTIPCDDCDGTGWQQERVSLAEFKKILGDE